MKTVELAEATASLSDYARGAAEEPVLVTQQGRPIAALVPVGAHTDLENLTVTTHPRFAAIMERSKARYQAEGGLSTEEVRRRLGLPRKRSRP